MVARVLLFLIYLPALGETDSLRVSIQCEPRNPRSSRNKIHWEAKAAPKMMHLGLSVTYALALVTGAGPSHRNGWTLASSRSSRQPSPTMPSHGRSPSCPTTASSSPRDEATCVSSTRPPSPRAPSPVCPPSPTASRGGLHDVALHPKYAENSIVHISYAESGCGRGGRGSRAGQADAERQRRRRALSGLEVIWRHSQKASGGLQFACRLLFGPDGALWISSGEINQMTPSQSMTGNLGKMIKLYDNGTAFAGNPFASQGAVQAQI